MKRGFRLEALRTSPGTGPLFLCYHFHVMGKYDSELATLHIWQKTSTKLFLNFAGAGATIRCLGTLKQASAAELLFGRDDVDSKDFTLVFNVQSAHFSFMDHRDVWQYWARPDAPERGFGESLKIFLLPGSKGATVVLAEVLGKVVSASAAYGTR